MKAAQVTQYGDPSVIQVNDIEKPNIKSDQVLVEVYAASLNPWDTTVRSGGASSYMPLELPFTPGGDLAGVVVEVGSEVVDLKVGDKVFGSAGVPVGSGSFAEFAVAPAGQLANAPSGLDFTDIASLPLVGVSALQALTEYLQVQAGDKVLIQGGAGGIGSVAVQIAKHLGAYVAATTATSGVELVKSLGADEVIDYTTQDFTQLIHDYDVVFDTVGGDTFQKSLDVLKPSGRAGSMIANLQEITVPKGITVVRTDSEESTERLNKLRELVEKGVVTPRVGKVFSLAEVQEAFKAREAGSVNGKIVLTIQGE